MFDNPKPTKIKNQNDYLMKIATRSTSPESVK